MRFGTRHMTKAERAAFQNVGGQQAWQEYREAVEGATTLARGRIVAGQGPRSPHPGSALYARLGLFLEDFRVPPKTTPAERVLYRDLIRRLEQSGDLDTDRMWALLEELNRLEGPR
jgi:hypothetical protein